MTRVEIVHPHVLIRRRIEDIGGLDAFVAMVRGRVRLVPTHHQQPTVGKLDVTGTEEVIRSGDIGEGARAGIPHRRLEGTGRELVGVITRPRDEQHVTILEKCGMDGPDR